MFVFLFSLYVWTHLRRAFWVTREFSTGHINNNVLGNRLRGFTIPISGLSISISRGNNRFEIFHHYRSDTLTDRRFQIISFLTRQDYDDTAHNLTIVT